MPVTSTAERTALPQEMTEHYAKAIAILELHLDKGQEQLTAEATQAKDALDRVIYSSGEDAIFALYPNGEIICQPSYWKSSRYELQHFGRLVRPGGLLVVGPKQARELMPKELYDVAWELRENLNLHLNHMIEWWADLNQAVLDGVADSDIRNKVRGLPAYMDSEKFPAISTGGQESLFTWGYPLREIGGLLSLGRQLYNSPIAQLHDGDKTPRVPDTLPKSLDAILTLIDHPSAGLTPIGSAAVVNGIKAAVSPLTHLEGLGNALAEANEDWLPVIDKATEIGVRLSDYRARLKEKQP